MTPAPDRLIEAFIPRAEFQERHETLIHAPAELVLEVAQQFDMQSIPLVRAIFWLRQLLLGTKARPRTARGLLAETRALGWTTLAHRPGREIVMGAVAQPWKADVVFRGVAPDRFRAFDEPDLVKIVWTLEVDAVEPGLSRFRTETRVLATDADALAKFRRYWRVFGIGIVLIRWLMLPALRREAERRAADGTSSLTHGAVHP